VAVELLAVLGFQIGDPLRQLFDFRGLFLAQVIELGPELRESLREAAPCGLFLFQITLKLGLRFLELCFLL
jgi:hypothetical protein